ncbi:MULTISPECIES: ABC transporter permease [unclassified Paenibacillus]|uniref:ABC transporter permease n=1 Tax=unclassified Paenibacillus TaxID=185978 RepID=UPI001C0FD155|nr:MULTISPECIES: ABC transporter permease [unclassified Paenibacillus]MBU5442584.1 ABC transporter permease [Paenibacillus sp. MSJ-34]CAH0119038.1 hypothetical protein PAE9249_01535 [Paenibacillus sp. CECT 9249]
MTIIPLLQSSLESGVLYAIMALGVYLTFRVLDFPDLTVDGSFVTGAAIAAVSITAGIHPVLASLFAFVGGAIAGMLTGILHTKGKINPLLSGILMMIALYSINLRILGKPNIPLLGKTTIYSWLDNPWIMIAVMAVVVIAIKLALDWFLHTELGMALRATGDNARMIRSFGVHTDRTIIIGVSLSNALVALAGSFVAQNSGYAEVQMGVGMIVIGLASVIIGEAIFGTKTVFRVTLAVMLGAIIYRMIIVIALRIGLNAQDMKLITALIVILALTLPMIQKRFRSKLVGKKRSEQMTAKNGGAR